MIRVFAVGMGGFLGAVSRYSLYITMSRFLPKTHFPFATLSVNIIGCLLLGILMALMEHRQILNPDIRLFLMVGFLASFTTFSTYSFESFYLIQHHYFAVMLSNIALQTILGIMAVWAGYMLAFKWSVL